MTETNSASEEAALLGGDYVVIRTGRAGMLFIETRVHDVEEDLDIKKLREELQIQLSRPNQTFELSTDLLDHDQDARGLLGPLYHKHHHQIESLKVVEYVGPATELNTFSSNDVQVKVQVYELYRPSRFAEEQEGLPQADLTHLPHVKFDGLWDALYFETDIKSNLIWMMINILRFSQASGRETGDTNPLILLYGPPGTGKTSLCQGLAQKISIRLKSTYQRTTLIQIKAAALLSKYYSESAKQVDMIFTTLQQRCEDDPEEFVCVLIDEVESIAISREASANGESQESLRATNAFLTGLDRTKGYPNIVFLCTSNMIGSLDTAFLDRCGLKHEVELPSVASQYAILRERLQRLVSRGVILSGKALPLYRDAKEDTYLDSELPGSRLLHIIELLDTTKAQSEEEAMSGRSLTQLPEQALLRYLRGEECDLDMALGFIERYIKEEQARVKMEEPEVMEEEGGAATLPLGDRPAKRKAAALSEEDDDILQGLGVLGDLIAGEILRRRKVLSLPPSKRSILDAYEICGKQWG